MRCFLAVPLGEPALTQLGRFLVSLRGKIPGVAWTRPETLHLTLHFFGSITDADAVRGVEAVAACAAATPPFVVVLDSLGAFPPRGEPRVLWLGSQARNVALEDLAAQACGALEDSGFEVERRSFRAHCTIGRPRAGWNRESRDAWRKAVDTGVPATSFRAERVVLYESRPAPGGAEHTPRAELALGGMPVS